MDEIAVINSKHYRYSRTISKNLPRLGWCAVLEMVNIDDKKDTQRFIRGIDVEVIPGSGM
jgi:hypothetical protein